VAIIRYYSQTQSPVAYMDILARLKCTLSCQIWRLSVYTCTCRSWEMRNCKFNILKLIFFLFLHACASFSGLLRYFAFFLPVKLSSFFINVMLMYIYWANVFALQLRLAHIVRTTLDNKQLSKYRYRTKRLRITNKRTSLWPWPLTSNPDGTRKFSQACFWDWCRIR